MGVLAVGIAATTVGFSVLNAFFLRPLPYASPERLVQLHRTDPQRGASHLRFSLPNFLALRRATEDVFEDLAAYNYGARNLASPGQEPERLMVGNLTTNMLDLLGAPPSLGRGFSPEDGRPGAPGVVLLDHGVWQRRWPASTRSTGGSVTLTPTPASSTASPSSRCARRCCSSTRSSASWCPSPWSPAASCC